MRLKESYMVGAKKAYASTYEARALVRGNLKQALYYDMKVSELNGIKSEMNPLEKLACFVGHYDAMERVLAKRFLPQQVLQKV